MSIKYAKDLVEQFEAMTERVAKLQSSLHWLGPNNEYRHSLHFFVAIQQGAHPKEFVEVSEGVVRGHFEVELANCRSELQQIEARLTRLNSPPSENAL